MSFDYRLLFDQSRDPMLIVASDGRLTEVNAACRTILGIDAADTLHLRDIVVAANWEVCQRHWKEAQHKAISLPFAVRLVSRSSDTADELLTQGRFLAAEAAKLVCGMFRPQAVTADQSLAVELLRIYERKMDAIAGEIHDGLIQDVFGVQMWLQSIGAEESRGEGDLADSLAQIRKAAAHATHHARQVMGDLRPITSEFGIDEGMRFLVDNFAKQSDVAIDFQPAAPIGSLSDVVKTNLLRIVQDALRAAMMSGSRLCVELDKAAGQIRLAITDELVDGKVEDRFDFPAVACRAKAVGGEAEVRRLPSGGAQLEILLPTRPSPMVPG